MKWWVFARKGSGNWPFHNDAFPKSFLTKRLANQCMAETVNFGAAFAEVIPYAKVGHLGSLILKDHMVVRCEREGSIFAVKVTPDILCPKCGRNYTLEMDKWISDRPLTVLYTPEDH